MSIRISQWHLRLLPIPLVRFEGYSNSWRLEVSIRGSQCGICRVATVREKVWKMNFFPGQGKVREFGFELGKFAKVQKIREKSGNLKIFPKVMVFGNVSMS